MMLGLILCVLLTTCSSGWGQGEVSGKVSSKPRSWADALVGPGGVSTVVGVSGRHLTDDSRKPRDPRPEDPPRPPRRPRDPRPPDPPRPARDPRDPRPPDPPRTRDPRDPRPQGPPPPPPEEIIILYQPDYENVDVEYLDPDLGPAAGYWVTDYVWPEWAINEVKKAVDAGEVEREVLERIEESRQQEFAFEIHDEDDDPLLGFFGLKLCADAEGRLDDLATYTLDEILYSPEQREGGYGEDLGGGNEDDEGNEGNEGQTYSVTVKPLRGLPEVPGKRMLTRRQAQARVKCGNASVDMRELEARLLGTKPTQESPADDADDADDDDDDAHTGAAIVASRADPLWEGPGSVSTRSIIPVAGAPAAAAPEPVNATHPAPAETVVGGGDVAGGEAALTGDDPGPVHPEGKPVHPGGKPVNPEGKPATPADKTVTPADKAKNTKETIPGGGDNPVSQAQSAYQAAQSFIGDEGDEGNEGNEGAEEDEGDEGNEGAQGNWVSYNRVERHAAYESMRGRVTQRMSRRKQLRLK